MQFLDAFNAMIAAALMSMKQTWARGCWIQRRYEK